MLTVMLSSKKIAVGAAGIIVMGLLMGSVCPNIFGYMFSKVEVSFHGAAFGILFALGVTGGSVIPGLVGITSRKSALQKGFRVNLIAAFLFGITTLVMILL
jgi:hypothetical protein